VGYFNAGNGLFREQGGDWTIRLPPTSQEICGSTRISDYQWNYYYLSIALAAVPVILCHSRPHPQPVSDHSLSYSSAALPGKLSSANIQISCFFLGDDLISQPQP